jgi:hypothetical protein
VLVILVLEFVVQPLSTLLHELGHGLAVAWLGKRRALVVVGRGPWADLTIGRLDLRFSPLPTRGVSIRGVCAYDPARLPWRSLALIALAGPLATFLELVALVAAAPALWPAGPMVRALLLLTAGGLVASLLINLSAEPSRADGARAVIAQRDGWNARRALALHRQGAPPPTPAANQNNPGTHEQRAPSPPGSADRPAAAAVGAQIYGQSRFPRVAGRRLAGTRMPLVARIQVSVGLRQSVGSSRTAAVTVAVSSGLVVCRGERRRPV